LPLGYCLQSHEILLNKGMKYWDSAVHACTRLENICSCNQHTSKSLGLKAFRWRKDRANSV
jgi:hypothetical protein